MIAEWWANRSLDWSSGVMKPKPLSSLNHLTVPVAIAFPPASIVLRARRLRGKSYDRWHCDVGRITRPDLATVAVPTDRRSASGRARQASQPGACSRSRPIADRRRPELGQHRTCSRQCVTEISVRNSNYDIVTPASCEPSSSCFPGDVFVQKSREGGPMATATKKVRAAAPPDRTRPAVPEAASLEFRIYLDNGGR